MKPVFPERFRITASTGPGYHPPKAEYVDHHPFCLHLWKQAAGEFPAPPAIMVGPPARG